MSKTRAVKLGFVASALVATAAGCSAAEPGPSDARETVASSSAKFVRVSRPIPRKYIVVLDDRSAALRTETTASLSASLAGTFRGKVLRTYDAALQGFAAEMDESDARALAEDPRVKLVEEDGVVQAIGTQSNATWGLDRIDQSDLPLNRSYSYAVDGTGVHAYVIDTGVRSTHRDFGGRVKPGFSSVDDDRGSEDCNGHGTHVAGTVGSTTYGVAKNVTIHAVRVLGCDGIGEDSGVIAGIDWVTKNAERPAVANMSLGGEPSQAVDEAVQRAIAAGITIVLAAGNESQNACNVSPARTPEAITVGSSTRSDGRSSFSNFGTCVDIFAPGSSITSTSSSSDTATRSLSGTSMASPHVAGAAALYLQGNPAATPQEVRDALVTNGTKNKLSNPGSGSPNVLLNTSFITGDGGGDGGGGDGGGGGTATTLEDSGTLARGASKTYGPLDIAPGSSVEASTTGTGDIDLYVRFDATPTTSTYACKSDSPQAAEACTAAAATTAKAAYVLVRGYSAGSYNLSVKYTKP